MLDYAIFLTKRAILQFLCNVIPFKETRKKARNAVFGKFIGDTIITVDKVDSLLPSAVLAQINSVTNEYFIAKNRQIITNNYEGGGAIITPRRAILPTIITRYILSQNPTNKTKLQIPQTPQIPTPTMPTQTNPTPQNLAKPNPSQPKPTLAISTLTRAHKIQNPRSILGRLSAFAMKLSRLKPV